MNQTEEFAVEEILKIESLENGKYQVFFTFSEVPVIMNKAYLKTVLSPREIYRLL